MAYYKCCHIWRLYECHCLPSKIVLALKITDMVLNYLHPPNVSECHTHWYLSSHRHVCQTCAAEFVSSQRPRGYIWLYSIWHNTFTQTHAQKPLNVRKMSRGWFHVAEISLLCWRLTITPYDFLHLLHTHALGKPGKMWLYSYGSNYFL